MSISFKMNGLTIATSVLNSMFFLAGLDKIGHFDKVVSGIQASLRVSLPTMFLQLMIVAAIAIEIIAPLIILRTTLHRSKENDKMAAYASVSLIVFTVLATLIYHFPPTTSAKYYPFMSNLSAVGGLTLMWCVFNGNFMK